VKPPEADMLLMGGRVEDIKSSSRFKCGKSEVFYTVGFVPSSDKNRAHLVLRKTGPELSDDQLVFDMKKSEAEMLRKSLDNVLGSLVE